MVRKDRKCARFVYGIYPNHAFSGEFEFGADISFRRWGKLETPLYGKSIGIGGHRALHGFDRALTGFVNLVSDVLQPINPKRRLNGALVLARNVLLSALFEGDPDTPYDEFVLECFSPEEKPFRLILDHHAGGEYKLRHCFDIRPGWNFHTLPATRFRLSPRGAIALSPENSDERRLIFTWLDFVRLRPGYKAKVATSDTKRQPKVKCVAWDLDNTLWRGTLVEDGEHNLQPNAQALDLIRLLDDRGIIQTVVSKNNFPDAWAVIERLGVQDYFLHPAINWQPKSENLARVA